MQLGSYDPAGGHSLFEYLFLSVEGWLILGVAVLCAYVYLNLATFFLSPVLESLWIRREERLEQSVMRDVPGPLVGAVVARGRGDQRTADDDATCRCRLLPACRCVNRCCFRIGCRWSAGPITGS